MSEITNPYIKVQETQRFNFSPTPDILKLKSTQKVNQKVVLSFYGNKIDMPFKFVSHTNNINITSMVAHVPKLEHEAMESYKVEITHPLGNTFFRCDVPKLLTASSINLDAFNIAELNARTKKEFEDYLVSRKQYDLEFSAMDLSHRQARLGRKYEYISKGIDVALGAASLGVAGFRAGVTGYNFIQSGYSKATKHHKAAWKEWHKTVDDMSIEALHRTGAPDYPKTKKWMWPGYKPAEASLVTGLGAYRGTGSLASGIVGLVSASERAALQEEEFGIQIKQKALESYKIDLGFDAQKDEQLMTMRRIFANETYNDVSSRYRQRALDELESPAVPGEIYLEIWTTSDLQDSYVTDYHDKFGVDCRVVLNPLNKEQRLYIKDEMRVGIYCIEDVVIENLADRVELEYLKTRLTAGIRFVEWIEHEQVKELTPIDKRIKELQDIIDSKDRTIAEKEENIENANKRYHQLSENFREKETELSEQQKLVGLYRDEVTHLKKDLIEEHSKHSQEKEDHTGTKEAKEKLEGEKSKLEAQLKDKTNEVQTLTQQVDRQLQENQQQKSQISSLNEQLSSCKQETATAKRQKQVVERKLETIEKERDDYKQRLEGEGLKPEVDRLTEEVRQKEQELQKSQQSLTAVREIENQLKQQISQLEERKDSIKLPLGFVNNLLFENMPLSTEGEKKRQGYFAKLTKVVKVGEKYVVLQWDPNSFCFEQLKDRVIVVNPNYSLFTIVKTEGDFNQNIKMSLLADNYYTYESNFQLESKWIRRKATGYWQYYTSYFSARKTNWAELAAGVFHWIEYFYEEEANKIWQLPLAKPEETKRKAMSSVYIHPVMFCEHEWTLPYFSELSSTLKQGQFKKGNRRQYKLSQTLIVGREREDLVLNETPVYWEKETMSFTSRVTEKRINNYGDYCDVLGIQIQASNSEAEVEARRKIINGGV